MDPKQPCHRAAVLGSLPEGGPQALELLVNSTLRNSLLHLLLQYWETQPLMKLLSVLTRDRHLTHPEEHLGVSGQGHEQTAEPPSLTEDPAGVPAGSALNSQHEPGEHAQDSSVHQQMSPHQ